MNRTEELVKKGGSRMNNVSVAAIIAGVILGPALIITGLYLRIGAVIENTAPADILMFIGGLFSVLLAFMLIECIKNGKRIPGPQ